MKYQALDTFQLKLVKAKKLLLKVKYRKNIKSAFRINR